MRRLFFYLLSFIWMANSCMIDDKPKENEFETGNGETTVSFTIEVPGQSVPVTKAMNDAAENYVKSIDVLAFKIVNGEELFEYAVKPFNFQPTNERYFSFTVSLYKEQEDYRFVVLTNCNVDIEALGQIGKGAYKELLLERLIRENESYWLAQDSVVGGFTPIPMWGESEKMKIYDDTKITDLKLVRMVSRVDVVLSTEEAKNNFKLNSVRVYNRSVKGYIVPFSDNFDNNTKKVIKPSLPIDDSSWTIEYPGGNVYNTANDNDVSLVGEIYLFEAAAGDSLSNAICLVVGGRFGNDAQDTYYRLDFVNPNDDSFKAVLRNHLYRFNITTVEGSGHETPDEAYKSRPFNIQSEIIVWDHSDMNDVLVGYDFFLSVNKSLFEFKKEARDQNSSDNLLKVYTDHKDGWVIEKIVEATDTTVACTWLTVDVNRGDYDVITEVKLLFPENNTSSTRKAKIFIAAGRLRHVINVHQTPDGYYSVIIEDEEGNEINELVFPANPQYSKTFYVKWTPTVEALEVAAFNNFYGTGTFGFATSSGSDILESTTLSSNNNGYKRYTIFPTAITNNDTHRAIQGMFTINNANLSKYIILRQLHYYITPEGVQDSYPLNGSQYSFMIKANVNWKATILDNTDGVIIDNSITTSGEKNESGIPFYFRTRNGGDAGEAVVRFTSYDDEISVDVTIKCGTGSTGRDVLGANCYIVKPGGDAISIPVGWANTAHWVSGNSNYISSNETLKAKLVWTDNSQGIAANSNIANIQLDGTGSAAKLIVKSGTAEGNAVVAVTDESGTVKWSWHIWVTDYDPDANSYVYTGEDVNHNIVSYRFMDRNLGALNVSKTGNELDIRGLFYQWGRKDPFPRASVKEQQNTSGWSSVYDENRAIVDMSKDKVPGITNNLTNAIQNPQTFYWSDHVFNQSLGDWYTGTTNLTDQNDDLWGTEKLGYDPCPEGWHVADWHYPGLWGSWNLGTYKFTWDSNKLGVMSVTYQNDFWPAAGRIVYDQDNSVRHDFNYVGQYGFYWSGNIRYSTSSQVNPNPDNLYFNNKNEGGSLADIQNTPVFNKRASGFSVRCVKLEN